jgi:hypothetical protein
MAKKKTKRDYDEDDDLDDDTPPAPKSDVYTGLVAITTIALIAAGVLFYLDGDKFAQTKAANPNVAPGALVALKN